MQYSKVEICGVNTSKLAVLDDKSKRELLLKSKRGDLEARSRHESYLELYPILKEKHLLLSRKNKK